VQPAAGANQPAQEIVEIVRAAAWNRLGVEYAGGAPLAEYARKMGLGAPLGNLFEAAGHVAQAYYGGIVLAPLGEPGRVSHIAW
jgi:hypothetical protein